MKKTNRPSGTLICALAVALGGVAQAQVNLNSNVAFDIGTGVYTYSYSIMNNGPLFDLAIVTLPVAASSNPTMLTAPTGFGLSFDPGIGSLSFFEDASLFTPQTFAPGSTVGTFTFKSPVAPASVTFSALDGGGNTFTGPASAPGAAIPEPASMLFGIALVAPMLFPRNRRTRNTEAKSL